MPEMNRVLIGSVELDKTKAGKPVVNLYSTDTRLQFPVLRLFDASALLTVGIDPDSLGTDAVHCRLWAYYTESDKTTSQGTPYKDVQFLERVDAPATATSTDNSALLAELRAIRGLLEVLAGTGGSKVVRSVPAGPAHQSAPEPETAANDLDQAFPRYGDGSLISDNEAEVSAFGQYLDVEGHPPQSLAALRQWALAQKENGEA